MIAEILELKRRRGALILAHNYQIPEIQDLADYVGDSLGLAREAARAQQDLIVFCGVHFMAETAAILNPDKTVLLPDPEAGCSLADAVTAEDVRRWRAGHPDGIVVAYVNTTAEVKAEADYCCTSANAVQVVRSLPADREVLFVPDMFLGAYVERMTGRRLDVWAGECHVHAQMHADDVRAALDRHPDAQLLVHPECGCVTSVLYDLEEGTIPRERTAVVSTEGMVRAVGSPVQEFVVATEVGVLHRMRKAAPDKVFHPLSEDAVCRFMKRITLEKLYVSLRDLVHPVTVPEPTASRARRAIERMLAAV